MTEMITWLRQQLDTDERLANACIAEVGSERAGDPYEDGSGIADRDSFPYYPWGSQERELAYMAAPGHPARVLCQVQAKRRILEIVVAQIKAAEVLPDGHREASRARAVAVAQLLASIYSDRDGYNPDWSA